MKIRVFTTVFGADYCYQAGEVVEAPEERAKDLIRGNHAVQLDSVVKPINPEQRKQQFETRKK